MNFTPEVITAIETLRKNAENEFELHRISVLEKDLTAPPKVEIIDEKHHLFNGVNYRKISDGHFACSNSLQRDIWAYYKGAIPLDDDYDVHHIDFDKQNNDINNLQLLTRVEHMRLHFELQPFKKYVCENCGKIFYSNSIKSKIRCCSRECISQWHYRKNHEDRTCIICGKTFSVFKYSKTQCCSQSCARKWSCQNKN